MRGVTSLDDAKEKFKKFFEELNGFCPYQWQLRLLEYVLTKGKWPRLIDVPTGAGKTAAIEVHVFCSALAATGEWPEIPRRFIATVNRRALVDKQFEKADAIRERLAKAVKEEPQSLLAEIAKCMRLRAGETSEEVDSDNPFTVVKIRGGLGLQNISRDWRYHPARVMVICITPDMFGSRLLWRGYGTSANMRPVEAGLLAYDSVLFLDEAHLNRQLGITALQVARLEKLRRCSCFDNVEGKTMPSSLRPLQVCKSSATPGKVKKPASASTEEIIQDEEIIQVEESDFGFDRGLKKRLTRDKPIKYWQVPSEKGSGELKNPSQKDLLNKAIELHSKFGGPIACVFNTPKDACNLAIKLEERLKKEAIKPKNKKSGSEVDEVLCVVGRMRQCEAESSRKKLKNPEKLAFVVGTQTLEVGIDVDFKGMLTELSSASALAQRAGRVNRSGKKCYTGKNSSGTEAVYVFGPTRKKDVYSEEEKETAKEWVEKLAVDKKGITPKAVAKSGLQIEMRRAAFERLELADIEYFSKTSEGLASESRVLTGRSSNLTLWLNDDFEDSADVFFAVRHRPCGMGGKPISGSVDAMAELLNKVGPLEPELASCPIRGARKIAKDLLMNCSSDEGPSAIVVCSGASDGGPKVLDGEGKTEEGIEKILNKEITPDCVIVVDEHVEIFLKEIPYSGDDLKENLSPKEDVLLASLKCFSENSGKSAASFPVPFYIDPYLDDGSDEEKEKWAELYRDLHEVCSSIEEDEGDNERLQADEGLLRAVLVEMKEIQLEPNPAQYLLEDVWEKDNGSGYWEPSKYVDESGLPLFWVYLPNKKCFRIASEEDATSNPVRLNDHQEDVAKRVVSISETLKLPKELKEALRIAALHHDDGKKALGFQRYLGNEDGEIPIAKSSSRFYGLSAVKARKRWNDCGLPEGWRHEQLSALLAFCDESIEEQNKGLVTRLIATSHGYCRSLPENRAGKLLRPLEDKAIEGLSACAENLFDCGLWDEIVFSTDTEYGYWFVSYLEALLRAADIQVSSEGK